MVHTPKSCPLVCELCQTTSPLIRAALQKGGTKGSCTILKADCSEAEAADWASSCWMSQWTFLNEVITLIDAAEVVPRDVERDFLNGE